MGDGCWSVESVVWLRFWCDGCGEGRLQLCAFWSGCAGGGICVSQPDLEVVDGLLRACCWQTLTAFCVGYG
jgi:hypothetical protein